MPPKRAAAAAKAPSTPVFEGLVFAVSGTLTITQTAFKDLVTSPEGGGKFAATLTNAVTHLVAADASPSTKLQKAQSNDLPIVTLDFVTASLKKKKLMDPKDYSVLNLTAASTSTAASPPPATISAAPAIAKARGTKRKVGATQDDPEVDEQDSNDAAKKSKKSDKPKLKVPTVDPRVPGGLMFKVFIDQDELAWNARLSQTEIGNNNNKFYIIQLLEAVSGGQYALFCRWGRMGENGQQSFSSNLGLAGALKAFERKYKDKTREDWANRDNFVKNPGKYYLQPPEEEVDDEEDGEKVIAGSSSIPKAPKKEVAVPESKLHPKVQSLMSFIFNTQQMAAQMAELDYDAEKMPLGKLAKSTLNKGYDVLKRIAAVIESNQPDRTALATLASEFYTVIPHSFGRHTPPLISTAPQVKAKLEMLESLGAIEVAQRLLKENSKLDELMIMNPLDRQFDSLKLNKLEPMDPQSDTYKLIEAFTANSHGATHSNYKLQIEEIFDLDRQGEKDRFDSTGFDKLHNRRLLWHGSRSTNFCGILSEGLRIAPPSAPVSGYMFGKGVYLADCVSKSANYCFTSPSNPDGLMLLCEAALGDMLELKQSDYYAEDKAKKASCHSTKGLGRTHPDEALNVTIENDLTVTTGPLKRTLDNSLSLEYNEYIVYDQSQIRMRFLIRMKFVYGGRR